MTNKTNLPTIKTLSNEEMKSIRGGLILNRNSLSTRPTTRNRFGSYGILGMNGIVGMNGITGSYGTLGILGMNG